MTIKEDESRIKGWSSVDSKFMVKWTRETHALSHLVGRDYSEKYAYTEGLMIIKIGIVFYFLERIVSIII